MLCTMIQPIELDFAIKARERAKAEVNYLYYLSWMMLTLGNYPDLDKFNKDAVFGGSLRALSHAIEDGKSEKEAYRVASKHVINSIDRLNSLMNITSTACGDATAKLDKKIKAKDKYFIGLLSMLALGCLIMYVVEPLK
jgi:hypothetical protein